MQYWSIKAKWCEEMGSISQTQIAVKNEDGKGNGYEMHDLRKNGENRHTSKSTIVVSWLPTPLDQNWATANSIVRPPSTGKKKVWADGDENVTTLSVLIGLFKGESCRNVKQLLEEKFTGWIPVTWIRYHFPNLQTINEESARCIKAWCSHGCLNPSSAKRYLNESSFYMT